MGGGPSFARVRYSFSSCHRFSIGFMSGDSDGVYHQLMLLGTRCELWVVVLHKTVRVGRRKYFLYKGQECHSIVEQSQFLQKCTQQLLLSCLSLPTRGPWLDVLHEVLAGASLLISCSTYVCGFPAVLLSRRSKWHHQNCHANRCVRTPTASLYLHCVLVDSRLILYISNQALAC